MSNKLSQAPVIPMDFTKNILGPSSSLENGEDPGFSTVTQAAAQLRHTQRLGGICRVKSVSAETLLEGSGNTCISYFQNINSIHLRQKKLRVYNPYISIGKKKDHFWGLRGK